MLYNSIYSKHIQSEDISVYDILYYMILIRIEINQFSLYVECNIFGYFLLDPSGSQTFAMPHRKAKLMLPKEVRRRVVSL